MVWLVVPEMQEFDRRLKEVGPMGYSLVVHLRGLTPEYYVSTFPDRWVAQYVRRQYAMFDPVNLWARTHSGRTRWSDIDVDTFTKASNHIMRLARAQGLVFGGGASRNDLQNSGALSFLFCARQDRELSDEELIEIETILCRIVEGVEAHQPLAPRDLNLLESLARGLSYKEVALREGISPETVKKHLERIREILGAKNSVEAVATATRRGLILNRPDKPPKKIR